MLFSYSIFVIVPGVNTCNRIIKLESVIMCDCDINFLQSFVKCPKHTHHIQTSANDFSNLLFFKAIDYTSGIFKNLLIVS